MGRDGEKVLCDGGDKQLEQTIPRSRGAGTSGVEHVVELEEGKRMLARQTEMNRGVRVILAVWNDSSNRVAVVSIDEVVSGVLNLGGQLM